MFAKKESHILGLRWTEEDKDTEYTRDKTVYFAAKAHTSFGTAERENTGFIQSKKGCVHEAPAYMLGV